MNNDLDLITNANGGGLSLDVTGKYTSVRHERAMRNADKMTAGECAKRLRKAGHAITARDCVQAWRDLFTWPELEWHHSGFKPKAAGGGMGRTYFFTLEQVQRLADALPRLAARREELAREREQHVFGIAYTWDSDRGGWKGKKRNFKRLAVYNGPRAGAPRNFTECSEAQFVVASAAAGRPYYGWEEPRLSEFTS